MLRALLRTTVCAACLAAALLSPAVHSTPASGECACLWQGSFVDVQPDTDLVVAARVESSRGNAIDIDVTTLLRGPDYVQRARVWLQAADYCRPPPELFPEGSTWIMALKQIDEVPEDGFNPNTPNISYGRKGDYFLSSCGGYWLKLTGDMVSGALVESPRWAREPAMTPVLIDVVEAHIQGRIDKQSVLEATREDPAVRELMLDTREFLRSERR
ncbi:MAG: delta-aminolevulinic acid dehydratase [Chromatocurvus sp.]